MPSEKTILILMPRPESIGGVENYYNVLQLHRDDPRIEYFYVTGPSDETRLQFLRRLLTNYFRFSRMLSTGRIGLVVLNPTLDRRSFYRDAVFCGLAHTYRVATLVFFRGWDSTWENQIRSRGSIARFVFNFTFARVRRFIVLGKIFRDKLLQLGCSDLSVFWLETTVADSRFLEQFSLTKRSGCRDKFQIIFLGRLTKTKGPLVALDAFRIAQNRRPDLKLKLVVAGIGPEMQALAASLKESPSEHVDVIGPVRDEEKARLLGDSDLLVLPSTAAEGMPNAVLESMLYGLPVIVTAVGAIPEIVKHGENGLVAESPDPSVLAEWIIHLADDYQTWSRMSAANQDIARRRFAEGAVRARMRTILNSCNPES